MNQAAFAFGRKAAADPKSIETLLAPLRQPNATRLPSAKFEEVIEKRAKFLTAYQNASLADRYRRLCERAKTAEASRAPGKNGFADAVARGLFKVMAIKDEYEVARLFTDGSFAKQLAATFEGDWRLEFHLAPPFLGRKDPTTGLPSKSRFGPWMMKVFRVLAALRGLRGTLFDPFSYNHERKAERQLMADYMLLIEELAASLRLDNHATAVALAELPMKIRGFGYVKDRQMTAAKAEEAELLRRFRSDKSIMIKEAAE